MQAYYSLSYCLLFCLFVCLLILLPCVFFASSSTPQTQVLGCVILFIIQKPNYKTFIRASLDLFEH